MYIYRIEDAYNNREAISLYKLYYPERSRYIVRKSKGKLLTYFLVAKYKDETVAAMGLSKHKNGTITYSHIVTHPDHRQKFVANSIRYLAIKYCFDLGAKKISNRKKDNEFSHERLKAVGFILTYTQGRNKQQNRDRKKVGLDPIPVRYYYECQKSDIDWKEINRICKLIESGKQHLMIEE